MMPRSEPTQRPECGTTRGIWLHQRAQEVLCRECKDVKNAGARQRRKINPPDRDFESAKISAMRRLANEYPDRYQTLLIEEIAKRAMRGA